jgi:aryl-alcohol dehydrogenase-like predicted oxidoreductase/nucleoside-diphosphate-sugar epimerase
VNTRSLHRRSHTAASSAAAGDNRTEPSSKPIRLLILGGNRFIGAELVRQAIEQGHDVTVLSLHKPHGNITRWIRAPREAPLSRVLAKLAFDAVIDNIAFQAEHVQTLSEALRGRVKRYVLTSSVDIYGNFEAKFCDERDDERLYPFLHSRAAPAWETYIRGKRACEIAVRRSRQFEAVVIRPTIVIGMRDNILCPANAGAPRSLFFPLRIAAGGPILLRHTDTRLYQLVYVEDVARALLLGATHVKAAGQVFNAVGDEVWTSEGLIYALSRCMCRKTAIVRVSDVELKSAGLAHYHSPYEASGANRWSLFSNKRLKSLGWRPTLADDWGKQLFKVDARAFRNLAGERQRELQLASKLLNANPVSQTLPLQGKFRLAGNVLTSIGIGTYGGVESLRHDRNYFAAIIRSVRGGINLIDTAINYRGMRSERVVGRAVQRLVAEGSDRGAICVVTKGGFVPVSLRAGGVLSLAELACIHSISASYIALSMQQSLRNTELACIDVYLLHNPEISLERLGEMPFYEEITKTFALLEQKGREGVIGVYGMATWDGLRVPFGHRRRIDLDRVIQCSALAAGGPSRFAVLELPFNAKAREAATVTAQRLDQRLVSTLEFAAARGLLVLASCSAMSGRNGAAKSIEFARNQPGISCALVGMRQLQHVDDALEMMGHTGPGATRSAEPLGLREGTRSKRA